MSLFALFDLNFKTKKGDNDVITGYTLDDDDIAGTLWMELGYAQEQTDAERRAKSMKNAALMDATDQHYKYIKSGLTQMNPYLKQQAEEMRFSAMPREAISRHLVSIFKDLLKPILQSAERVKPLKEVEKKAVVSSAAAI